MKSMLQEILDTEKKARKRTEEAMKYKADTVSEVRELRQKLIEKKMQEAQRDAEKLRIKSEEEAQALLAESEAECRKTSERLEALSTEKTGEWVRILVERTAGVSE